MVPSTAAFASRLSTIVRPDTATNEASTDAARPIPLDGDRLWRAKLYRTTDEEHYLWLNMHHTITDGWSLGVLFKDLEAYYEAARTGVSAHVADLAVQYGDYAVWEQEWRRTPGYREQVEFWKKTLAAPLASLFSRETMMRSTSM